MLILGGFHKMMSYCGSISTLMETSDLSEAHKTCYGGATAKHIAHQEKQYKKLDVLIFGHRLQ